MSLTLQERVLKYSTPEPNVGCWLWLGGTNAKGYGQICVKGKRLGAHVASYMAFVGETNWLWVLHRCDVRCCVNPSHLFLGTHKDNMADMRRKLRAPQQKLTAAQIAEIDVSTLTPTQLGRKFGVCRQTIYRARRREYRPV